MYVCLLRWYKNGFIVFLGKSFDVHWLNFVFVSLYCSRESSGPKVKPETAHLIRLLEYVDSRSLVLYAYCCI